MYTEIINKVMTPFVRKTFNDDVQLHQDNDPKHTSVKCRAALDHADIKWVRKIIILNSQLIMIFKGEIPT
jgi:hypothetical protein